MPNTVILRSQLKLSAKICLRYIVWLLSECMSLFWARSPLYVHNNHFGTYVMFYLILLFNNIYFNINKVLWTVNWKVFNNADIPRQTKQLVPVPALCFVFFPPVLRFGSAFFVTYLVITACGPISGTEKSMRVESDFCASWARGFAAKVSARVLREHIVDSDRRRILAILRFIIHNTFWSDTLLIVYYKESTPEHLHNVGIWWSRSLLQWQFRWRWWHWRWGGRETQPDQKEVSWVLEAI